MIDTPNPVRRSPAPFSARHLYPFEVWMQCARKVAWPTKAEAKRIAKGHTRPGDQIKAYRCPHCAGWHIGHPPRRGQSTIQGEQVA